MSPKDGDRPWPQLASTVVLQASLSACWLADGAESLQRDVAPILKLLSACKLLDAPPPMLRHKLCYHAKLGRRRKLPFLQEALAGLSQTQRSSSSLYKSSWGRETCYLADSAILPMKTRDFAPQTLETEENDDNGRCPPGKK